ncbi:MAG: hypothetical protein ACT4OO_11285 [Nitrospiraceae bacterium]
MRTILFCLGVAVVGLAGCGEGHKYIDTTCAKLPGDTAQARDAAVQCQQFRQSEAATAVYNEAAQLLRSYRDCLQKYEQTPARAKEYCALYPKALHEIGLEVKEAPETATPRNSGAGGPVLKSR